MRRLLVWVLKWIWPPECVSMQTHTSPTRGEEKKGEGRWVRNEGVLWVDSSLLGMKQEIGLEFKTYPPVWRISARLKVNMADAAWIYNACNFSDRVRALVTINDMARALKAGVPITEIRERGMERMLEPAIWERH